MALDVENQQRKMNLILEEEDYDDSASDLTKLDEITLENVVQCLVNRFGHRQFCTFAGSVLLALNPCSPNTKKRHLLLDTAEREEVKKYVELLKDIKDLELPKLKPRVLLFGVKCLYNIQHIRNNQVIVVSGDSGAGKTTCTQDLIKFFTYSEKDSGEFYTLEQKIYQATHILEALGNASTVANPNSSRFGRLVQLHFNSKCRIVGAEIKTYLLEKHRVAKGNSNERNFHIFHYMLQAVERGYFDGHYKDIFQRPYWKNHVQETDLQMFMNLSTALTVLDLLDDFRQVFEILFAILRLLLVEFVPEEPDEDEKENFYTSRVNRFVVSDETYHHLVSASQILGIQELSLSNCFIYNAFSAGNRKSISLSPCTRRDDCESRLHSFVTTLYDKLFNQIVCHLNTLLNEHDVSTLRTDTGFPHQRPQAGSSVSILDLYGFESWEKNHFEQLCINYANERIQQIQISVMKGYFKEEHRLTDAILQDCETDELDRVELEISSRLGEMHGTVFSILDEACLLKRPTPDTAVFEQLITRSQPNRFITTGKPFDTNCPFVIRHYASEVTYSLAGMVVKNKDFIPEEFISVLGRSTKSFVSNMFHVVSELESRSVGTPKGKPEARKTILMRFKTSVQGLLNELCEKDDRDVHFIKCLRPNGCLAPNVIDAEVVKKQLYACGIVDIIRIAGNRFPVRIAAAKLRHDFPLTVRHICGKESSCKRLELAFSTRMYPVHFGQTHAFMTERTLGKLQRYERFVLHRAALIIQRVARKFLRCLHHSRSETPVANDLNHSECISTQNSSAYFTPMTTGPSGNTSFYSVGPSRLHRSFDTTGSPYSPLESSLLESGVPRQSYKNLMENTNATNTTVAEMDIVNSTLQPNKEMSMSSANISKLAALQSSQNYMDQLGQLYVGRGVISRAPVHSLPIKIYTKKTALGFIRAPPRLRANGIQDALEDYGILF